MVGKEGGKEFGRNDVVLICFECTLGVRCSSLESAHGSRAGINLPSSTGRCASVRKTTLKSLHSSSLIFIRSESEESIEIYVYLGDVTIDF